MTHYCEICGKETGSENDFCSYEHYNAWKKWLARNYPAFTYKDGSDPSGQSQE